MQCRRLLVSSHYRRVFAPKTERYLMSKIVLYFPNTFRKSRFYKAPPLPLLSIAAQLQDHNVKIVGGMLYKDPLDVLLKECRDALVFGVTAMTGPQIKDGLNITSAIKKQYPDLKVVWGGWHPSIFPEQVIEHPMIDYVIKGQGQRTLIELIEALKDRRDIYSIKGIYHKNDKKIVQNPARDFEDVNNFPSPAYHLIDMEKCLISNELGERCLYYVSSYGCPHRCGFCAEQGVTYRRWSGLKAERMIKDIEKYVDDYCIDSVAFVDSNFFVNEKRVLEFATGLIEKDIRIRWGNANGRTRELVRYKEDTWRLMKESGLYNILTGAESGLQEALELINKDASADDTLQFCDMCNRYGVKVSFSMFTGLPWQENGKANLAYTKRKNIEDIQSTFSLIDNIFNKGKGHRILLFNYTPYPGTPLYEKSKGLGFKEPLTLDGWGEFDIDRSHTDFLPEKFSNLPEIITYYILFFMDSDSLTLIRRRLRSTIMKFLASCMFYILRFICKARWKKRFFSFLLDYRLYRYILEKNPL